MRKQLVNRMKVLRAEHGMTQIELAKKVKIHVTRISQIETGAMDPTPKECRRIARALGSDVASTFPPKVGRVTRTDQQPTTRDESLDAVERVG